MKIFCLGGAGRICREAALDLVKFARVDRLTIGDLDQETGQGVVRWLNDERVDFKRIDILDRASAIAIMRGYNVVVDGTAISLNGRSTACIAEAGAHGINLNGFGEEYQFDQRFKDNGRIFIPGFGMTPGTTNMMAKYAASRMDTVETVRISHGAFRPVAFSASIAETTTYEYDPDLPGRVVYEDGQFIQVPPFARPLEVELPEPYGKHVQYIIPHSETKTLATYLADKKVKLIEVRGTWPAKNMQLIKALYEWGFLRNDKVKMGNAEFGIMDAIAAYLIQAPEGRTAELCGYALHVEVVGSRDGQKIRHVLWHTHPASDGSVTGWEGLRAYTRCVGIPLAVGAHLIAQGKALGCGVVIPEYAFEPTAVFEELRRREIFIHERTGAFDAHASRRE